MFMGKALAPVLVIFHFIIFSIECPGQPGIIQGYISDAESKTPLIGASINIAGNKADNSDAFGIFSIPGVSAGQYELTISHVGYKTEILAVDVKPNFQSTINVALRKASLDLAEVRINSKRDAAQKTIGAVDIRLRPINTSQDVLRIVPGLFIAQHAGGGKAEQIFLRGFDIDHGTDISISVDGMPVNMVSHAHGQGYADLHFLIPETVDKLSFEKGPYQASKGNLATAAYVDFSTKDFLDQNMIRLEASIFKGRRLMSMLKIFDKQSQKARQQFYTAMEYVSTKGYFDMPQNFHRLNVLGKYTAWFGNQTQFSVLASRFNSKWNASGQIPERAVRSGLISRYGAIDDSEGGNTTRTNLTVRFNKQWKNNWRTMSQAYFSRYKFDLYSNFTFFLVDTVNGDMINQREARNVFGYTTTAARNWFLGNKKASSEFGTGIRIDDVRDISLSKAVRRRLLQNIQLGDIKEKNAFVYVNQDIELSDRLELNAGLRYDYFWFRYRDKLSNPATLIGQRRGIFSPKLNLTFSLSQNVKVYLNNGLGFHSNDTRVIFNAGAKEILPKVIGTDLGFLIKPIDRLLIKATLWRLHSDQEFVYVGDAGIVEPGGRTRRIGVDISSRCQFNNWLFGDIDINLTKAKALDQPKGEDFVPLAPSFTSIGGLTAKTSNGISGSIRYRFIADRPANETNSRRADGYFLMDMLTSYRTGKWELNVSIENILDRDWKEAQFDTESRLKSETSPVTEIHFTPGIPRFLKAAVIFHF